MKAKLKDLLSKALGVELKEGDAAGDMEISGIADDSRSISGGEIFCCIRGEEFDGHNFAADAEEKGASAVVVERDLEGINILRVKVQNTREACSRLVVEFFENPSEKLQTIGITGTNGKTTTAHFLAHILGEKAVTIGTLNSRLTTPTAVELQKKLNDLLDQAVESVVLEISSHALQQHRVDGMRFNLSIFLNLGMDHLDYHGNQEEYFRAKARLFNSELSEKALVNTDTEWGRKLVRGDFARDFAGNFVGDLCPVVGFSAKAAEIIEARIDGTDFLWEGWECRISTPGKVNVANAVASLEAAKLLGCDVGESVERLKSCPPIKGRFEVLVSDPFSVVVDFAHTPDALGKVLKSARELMGKGSLKVVFGCGGERDRKKRPEMGRIAEQFADEVYLTSDNSRSEDTREIMEQIQIGIGILENIQVEPDRRAAIKLALDSAKSGDLVLIVGKGHETSQELKGESIHFSDSETVRELLGAS